MFKCLIYAGLCSNEIHTAIVNRSASHLQAALQRSPESIDEPNDAGHTPLHLAGNWPHGLSLLLSHGADLEKMDLCYQKAIEMAILHNCTEAVQQLLTAGCSFDIRGKYYAKTDNVLTFAVQLYQTPTWRASSPTLLKNYFEIVKIIIEELVSRGHAPVSEEINTVLDGPQSVDPGSVGAERSLQISTKSVPQLKSLSPGIHTVYHCPYLTVEIASELWSAGFREIDVPDDHHKTPLMTISPEDWQCRLISFNDSIKYAFWLYQKGASLFRPHRATLHSENSSAGNNNVPPFEPLAIHFVAVALEISVVRAAEHYLACDAEKIKEYHNLLGYSLPARLEPLIDDLSLDCQHFLHKIMLDASPDGCICACSKHGCLPVTCFLKRGEDIRFSSFYNDEQIQARYISYWKLLWLSDNVPSKQLAGYVFRAIVRLMTFERLGLRHTCCGCKWKGFRTYDFCTVDAEEAEEIRDEDREGIQFLESLLLKFEGSQGDRDLEAWFQEYWDPEMEEILAARDRVPLDEAGLKEAGVILCEDDRISHQDCSYD